MEEQEFHIRPLVLKLKKKKFREYVTRFGPEVVEECLRKGHAMHPKGGKVNLTVMRNRKDRFQMLQVLGMERDRSEDVVIGSVTPQDLRARLEHQEVC